MNGSSKSLIPRQRRQNNSYANVIPAEVKNLGALVGVVGGVGMVGSVGVVTSYIVPRK